MAQLADKVCPIHPKSLAVSRCETCFKPLCSVCVVRVEDKDFCSDNCATNFFTTNKSIEEFRKQENRQKFFRLIKKLIILTMLILVGSLAFFFWIGNKEKVESTTRQLKDKAKGLEKTINDKFKE